jgi:hypothetical protein
MRKTTQEEKAKAWVSLSPLRQFLRVGAVSLFSTILLVPSCGLNGDASPALPGRLESSNATTVTARSIDIHWKYHGMPIDA